VGSLKRAWYDKTDDDCVLAQHLYRDDGAFLGADRALPRGATYAWSRYGRIGAMSSDQAARDAVERVLEQEVGS
jgi:hypothetical protein